MVAESVALVAPSNVIDGPNGSVMVDPNLPIPQPAKPDAPRPEWLPEKFKTPEELAASYAELEKKIGAAPKPVDIKPAEAEAKGIDLKALSGEFAREGKLSEASMKTLADKGFTAEQVSTYIDGLNAQSTQTRASFAEIAGGDETLSSVLKWAQTSLSQEEQAAYNSLLEAGNLSVAKIAFKGIVAQYTEAVGKDPSLITGATVPGMTGIKPFASQAQVTAAMSDKRYATDPAYRAQIAKRISISNY